MVLELFRLKNYTHLSRLFPVSESMPDLACRPNQLLNCRRQSQWGVRGLALALTEFKHHPLSA